MIPDDGFSVLTEEETAQVGFRKTRGTYAIEKKLLREQTNGIGDGFRVLDEWEVDDDFHLVTPEQFDSIPRKQYRHSGHDREWKAGIARPVIFIDGEGANHGDPISIMRTPILKRTRQVQNYALLSATVEGFHCDMGCVSCDNFPKIIGSNNHDQIPTIQCLEFILHLPESHIIVGYGLTYDVEHWLRDLPEKKMLQLKEEGKVWWKRYMITYIPSKVFSIMKWKKGRKIASRTIYDIVGFFQSRFDGAIQKWEIGTLEEYEFIHRMKDARPGFGDVTDETLSYNHMEGKHGIRLFRKLRDQYTRLELRVQRPVGAGSIASAMLRKNRTDDYSPVFQPLPVEVMLSAYIGGRFDVARLGFVGNVYEYDINSAYPHIARNLPCLAHSKFEWTDSYVRDENSLWLVRWRDNDNPWAPFPYRAGNGNHIRYYNSGTGYYYGSEVESALLLDSDIEVLGGYRLIRECDERPFQWLETYYEARQRMKETGDFGEIILKLGCNSVYGKLAQTKGKTPRYQNLIWAGMITSGTRAMLMRAVCQNPRAVFKLSTDAVFSTVPLDLPLGNELGQWKPELLEDLLVLGNGIYHSANGRTAKNRGYIKDSKYFDWEVVRRNFTNGIPTIVTKHEFIGFGSAYHAGRLEERCMWVDEEQLLSYEAPEGKIVRGDWIWPGDNSESLVISAPIKIKRENLRVW